MLRLQKWVLPILAMVFLVGCATTGAPLSTKGKATMFLSTYNTQAELTKKAAIRCIERGPACTEAERETIRKKKATVVKLRDLAVPFGIIVDAGGVPSADDEQAIYDLIDQLAELSVGG